MDDQRPADIPSDLRHLIRLNVAYRVLICPYNKCCKAVEPRAFKEHLRVQHQTPLRDRERVQEYINGFKWNYDQATIQLPEDGSAPQPLIPVVDGFQCPTCPSEASSRPFTSINQKRMRVHGNTAHQTQRAEGNEVFRKVRLQSWFQDHRQRYWVVDESKTWDGHDQDVGTGEEEDSPSRLKEGEDVADINTDGMDKVVVIEARDEEVAEEVVNERVVEVIVIDDEEGLGEPVNVDGDEEVFSDFEDSGDEDYRESSADVGGGDDERGLSGVVVDSSDDEDYEVSSGVTDDDEADRLSMIEVDSGDDGDGSSAFTGDGVQEVDVIAVCSMDSSPAQEGRVWKKRRRGSGYEDGGMMDSDGSPYQDSGPGSRGSWGGQRAVKRQRMTRFEDSGVVMGSSQDDDVARPSSQDGGAAPPSSPPELGWIIGRRPGGGEDRSSLPESPSTILVNDDSGDDGEIGPIEPQVNDQCRGTVQSKLERLRERLDRWCRTCPACLLAGGFRGKTHRMTDCWRESTCEIIDRIVVMQRHMDRGFPGEGGCSWCGVPRAICQRWQVKADGKWAQVPGQQCQYMWMLVAAVITMMMDGAPEGCAVVGSWMDVAGVTRTSQVDVFEWFRQATWWEEMGVEVARIVRVFHMLVNKNSGVGKA
jgi:transcription elongation factor Elf1